MRYLNQFVFFLFLVFTANLVAQSPQAFQYQAVLRNSDGDPITNTNAALKISILSDTIQNVVQYSEIHNGVTDGFGKVVLYVGKGIATFGAFDEIDWAYGPYFIRIEIDPEGGTNFQFFGQTELLSVPYALYSQQSGDTYVPGEGINISGNTISNSGDLSESNEIQTITKFGNTILLSKGGGSVTDSDIQSLTLGSSGTNRQIQISNGNSINLDVADNDNNPANELQVISISHDTVFLSNGGFAKLPTPTNAIIPHGGCIQSSSQTPPDGYVYSGTGFSTGDSWSTLPSMSNYRFGSAVVAANNKIFVIGGWDGYNNVSNIVEVFDIQTQLWTRKANMPSAVVYSAGVAVGNLIYVLGGYNGTNSVNRNQVYNTATDSWSQGPVLPSARSGCGAAEISGKIYLVGGYFNSTILNTNEMFDPTTGVWTTKTAMTTSRTDFAMVCMNDGFYAIGGWGSDVLNTNEFYNPSTDTWTTYYPMSSYRSGCSGAVANNKIYVISGGDSYSYSSKVEEYDPLTNEWKLMKYMPQPRSFFGAVSVNNKIYVVGGSFGLALNSLIEYDPKMIQYYLHCAP